MEDFAPGLTYVNSAMLANADTVAIEFDIHGPAGFLLLFQYAGRDGNWSEEQQLHNGIHTIRRRCEYVRVRTDPLGTAPGAPSVTMQMLSGVDLPAGSDTGAPRA